MTSLKINTIESDTTLHVSSLLTASSGINANGIKSNGSYTPTIPADNSGFYADWNLSGSKGEMNIVSLSQGGTGGTSFYNKITSPISALTYLGGLFTSAYTSVPTGILYVGSIGRSIVPNYSYPVSSTSIGYVVKLSQVLGQPALVSGTAFTMLNEQAFTAGTWIITGCYRLVVTATTVANISLNVSKVLSGVSTTICNASYPINATAQTGLYPNLSFVFQADGVSTLSIVLNPIISASTVTYNGNSTFNFLYATRIA